MQHLQHFIARNVLPLPLLDDQGWQLKRYAILADGKQYNEAVVSAAGTEVLKRLPKPGSLEDDTGNHGIGFQLIHFAEVAIVSPVFYWRWGSVLSQRDQMRATWEQPTVFRDGVPEVVGCIWEMEIVAFEVQTWKSTLLSDGPHPTERLTSYLDQSYVQR